MINTQNNGTMTKQEYELWDKVRRLGYYPIRVNDLEPYEVYFKHEIQNGKKIKIGLVKYLGSDNGTLRFKVGNESSNEELIWHEKGELMVCQSSPNKSTEHITVISKI